MRGEKFNGRGITNVTNIEINRSFFSGGLACKVLCLNSRRTVLYSKKIKPYSEIALTPTDWRSNCVAAN